MYNTILRRQFLLNPIYIKQMWNLLNIFRDETQTFQEIKLRSLNKFYKKQCHFEEIRDLKQYRDFIGYIFISKIPK